jgi:hypothetical protein
MSGPGGRGGSIEIDVAVGSWCGTGRLDPDIIARLAALELGRLAEGGEPDLGGRGSAGEHAIAVRIARAVHGAMEVNP